MNCGKHHLLKFCVAKAHKGSIVRTTVSNLKSFKFDIFHMKLVLKISIKRQDAGILYFKKSVMDQNMFRKICFAVEAPCFDISGITIWWLNQQLFCILIIKECLTPESWHECPLHFLLKRGRLRFLTGNIMSLRMQCFKWLLSCPESLIYPNSTSKQFKPKSINFQTGANPILVSFNWVFWRKKRWYNVLITLPFSFCSIKTSFWQNNSDAFGG